VWMSETTCSNARPRVATRPASSAQNMNASSGSALCPTRIAIEATLANQALRVTKGPLRGAACRRRFEDAAALPARPPEVGCRKLRTDVQAAVVGGNSGLPEGDLQAPGRNGAGHDHGGRPGPARLRGVGVSDAEE